MRCPKCNRKTKQYKTQENPGHVLRHRECMACGYRFMTMEHFHREISVTERTLQREAWHRARERKP